MKKVLPIISFLLGLWPIISSAQTKCDTILTTDGRVIVCKIQEMGRLGILYGSCETKEQRKFHLPAAIIKDVKSPRANIRAAKRLILDDKVYTPRITKDSTAPKPVLKRTYWSLSAGLLVPVFPSDVLRQLQDMYFQYGLEVTSKHSPRISTAFYFVPMGAGRSENEGINASFGVMVKKFSYSRLTGVRSKFYWGADFRIGRLGSRYDGANTHDTSRWSQFMGCLGFQLGKRDLYVDLSVAGGISRFKRSVTGIINAYTMESIGLVLQPAASIGLRF
jgi:hypothetical protein